MRITDIKSLVCHARMRDWVFVKVVTDQPGLYGWGEATLEWHTRSVVAADSSECSPSRTIAGEAGLNSAR